MDKNEILAWLKTDDEIKLKTLWALADETRKLTVGDRVHLRGLVEVSNRCARNCLYCGIRNSNREVTRYIMDEHEIVECARTAKGYGYGTVVLQAGEDYLITGQWLARVIGRIKEETGLAVTLSMGERTKDELRMWKDAGADRYLLRFETSDRGLFERIHPGLSGRGADRVTLLRELRAMGYETGSGVMVGIPGQTYASLADDIALFAELDLDMIGIGPFIPHPETPLGREALDRSKPALPEQVPSSALMACKAVALARLVCPQANIPSTTALATIDSQDGRRLGLERGANIIMPNLTPLKYRSLYEIYPAKESSWEQAAQTNFKAQSFLAAIGRTPGTGPGGRCRTAPPA